MVMDETSRTPCGRPPLSKNDNHPASPETWDAVKKSLWTSCPTSACSVVDASAAPTPADIRLWKWPGRHTSSRYCFIQPTEGWANFDRISLFTKASKAKVKETTRWA